MILALLILASIAGWIFKGLSSQMSELNMASSAIYNYEPARSAMWFWWIAITIAGILFPPAWPVLIFFFLSTILKKTSPAVTWRLFFLYGGMTLCALTILGALIGAVAKVITREEETVNFRRRLQASIDRQDIGSL